MSSADTAHLLTALFIIGITAESMTAAVAAGRMRMDLFGVITLGALTALGGGTVRDIILDDYPLTWVEEPRYLIVVIVASVLTVKINWLMYHLRKFFLVADAIGLAAFVVLGIEVALNLGYGIIIAAVAAVLTGVSGGVMRDVLSDRVPLVFRKELYASIAVMGTLLYFCLMWIGVPSWINAIATVVFVLAVRLLSLKYNWSLPVFEFDDEVAAQFDPKMALSYQIRRNANRVPGARKAYRALRRMSKKDDQE
ncbi:trimeric intracellular cation channel family protein [Corynebacterium breve]|uniref:Trimeric intracellular cation channel family protein n=1 Tax=Corynebacterium breve TaxID=3049799 RepID=A0ABY8VEW7_9CORY|nr:trimeric intracellular cation channel family protein [Corynebacterium breve]WIM68199.1 trimeric intracellular cation channel family protein [Corynebacterium breve]